MMSSIAFSKRLHCAWIMLTLALAILAGAAGCGGSKQDAGKTAEKNPAETDVREETDATDGTTRPGGSDGQASVDAAGRTAVGGDSGTQLAPKDGRERVAAKSGPAETDSGARSVTVAPTPKPGASRVPYHPGDRRPGSADAQVRSKTDATISADPRDERQEAEAAGEPSATMVEVFYGTDRKLESTAASAGSGPVLIHVALALLVAGVLFVGGLLQPRRRALWSAAGFLLVVATVWFGSRQYAAWQQAAKVARQHTRYGNERGAFQLGTCLVSIPAAHEVGEVESPSLLRLEVREDVRKHVMLHEVTPEDDTGFYRKLRRRVESADRREVFVFVHGYNVTFENAARRTAQIAYDVRFAGAPIFFSWPSQGGLLRYTVDETNVAWAVPHLKQFLLDIAERSGADSVNLIAHSMGSRALTGALYELEREFRDRSELFNQVILAAPDIDAEIFCRDLAPALVRTAKQVTLYSSSNDQALAASKQVHGYPRAGDSGSGLIVLAGIDTIDVSCIDTSLLGHSYYGSSNPILEDMSHLIRDALPAARRRWLEPVPYRDLTYWVFRQVQKTAARATGRSND